MSGGGAFGGDEVMQAEPHDGIMGLMSLVVTFLNAPPNPFLHLRTQPEGAAHEPGRELTQDTESAGALILGFQPLQL